MKIKGIGNARTVEIEAKREYSIEELFEIFQREGSFSQNPPRLNKALGFTTILFPGEGGFENSVYIKKNKIKMTQVKTTAKEIGKTMALDMLTSNWNSLLNMEGSKNAPVMDEIGREIERLVT